MTSPLRRFDPFRPIDMLTALWSTTAAAPVSTGAAVAYRTLFTTVRRMVVGRKLAIQLDDGELTLTVTEFDSRLDVRRLSVGQLDDVRLAARDIRWQGHRFDHATAVLHNVHIRPTVPPVLVAAPVELTLEVPAVAIDELFRWVAPRWAGEVGGDGVARLRRARRPGLGHVEVEARLDGTTVWLRPRALVVRQWRRPLPARIPAYPVQLPPLPHGVQLTGVEFGPDMVALSGVASEWRMDMPRKRLEDIFTQLSGVGMPLNMTRLTRLF
ncbi:hypothetical protein [Mycolicibacterium sp. XJ1819]